MSMTDVCEGSDVVGGDVIKALVSISCVVYCAVLSPLYVAKWGVLSL